MIYNILLLIFILVSLMLIILITFNPINNNSYCYSYNNSNDFNILKFIYYDSFINFLTKILIVIFFILSIIICMFNTHQALHQQ